MPWRRWSVSRAALKAVTGQFVGRQTVLSAVILCALAAWFGTSTDLRVNPRIAVAGLVLAPVGLSATIASTWIGSGRWDDLARFPLHLPRGRRRHPAGGGCAHHPVHHAGRRREGRPEF
mgnify:CR=1 FL=1